MTPYERGYAAALKAAAELCKVTADLLPPGPFTGLCAETLQSAEQRILSLPIVGEADQRAKGEDSRTEQSCENGAAHPNPGEQDAGETLSGTASERFDSSPEGSGASQPEQPSGPRVAAHPARTGPSQECLMVPVVPTRAMEDAACAAGDNGNLSGQYLRNIWKAMLAAAKEE